MINISDDHRDALLELFNVGIGHAAASLSTIVKEEISLSLLRMEFLKDNAHWKYSDFFENKRVCAIAQCFSGPFDADALLIFPEDKTMHIVQKMLGGTVAAKDIPDLEQDALSEIGNIILNTCISAIGNTIRQKFRSTVPIYFAGYADDIFNPLTSGESMAIVLHIEFFMGKDEVHGYLVFLLNVHSFAKLLEVMDALLARYSPK